MLRRRKAPLRIDQRAEVLESVGRHEAGGGELPQRVFDDARQLARVLDDIGEKRGASAAQRFEHLTRGAGQSLIADRIHLRWRQRETDARVNAASSSHGASSRRNNATGAERVGRTRRAAAVLPRS